MLFPTLAFCASCLAADPLDRPSPSTSTESPGAQVAAISVVAPEGRATFDEIASRGLQNACYVDADHYVAEFLYQNPAACDWQVNEGARQVVAVPSPEVPSDAVPLPSPSGSDDTAALEAVINASPGATVVGQGTYRVDNLDILVPVTIHAMPMEPWRGAGLVVRVHAPDVSIYDSPIDAEGSDSTYTGFRVEEGAERFKLIGSGFSNARHVMGKSVIGVLLRGGRDFHLACNTFDNLTNRAVSASDTARANAIVINGSNRASLSGGVIANNEAQELQSSGFRQDAEFLTIQNLAGTDSERPVRVFANRAVDAGKRFTKHQEGDALVLSNDHEWTSKSGPLGPRKLLAHVEVQTANNVVARNNRVRIAADSRFDYVFHTAVTSGSTRQDNIHYDCNDIEIQDRLDPSSSSAPHLFVARSPLRSAGDTGLEATGSSVNGNRVHGGGSVKYHYWFGEGYRNDGGAFENIGNVIEVPALRTPFKWQSGS